MTGPSHARPGDPPRRLPCFFGRGLLLLLLLAGSFSSRAAEVPTTTSEPPTPGDSVSAVDPADPEEPKPPRARLTVEGLGWLENLEMKGVLRQLQTTRRAPEFYDANTVEDGAFLLLNRATRLGYLRAEVSAELTLADGQQWTARWVSNDLPNLPRPLQARRVAFQVETGRRYHYREVTFRGLTVLSPSQARRYFVRTDGLLQSPALRRYSRAELDQALGNLRSTLRQRGHATATVRVARLELDDATGEVVLEVEVEEGPVHRVAGLHVDVSAPAAVSPPAAEAPVIPRRWSPTVVDDLEREILRDWYHEGYPEARVTVIEEARTMAPDGIVELQMSGRVEPGPRIRLGEEQFTGPGAERFQSALRRRTALEGPWLDRLEVDEARARLGRVGGFRFVNVRYDIAEEEEGVWNPVFELEPGRLLTVDLLAGFRSYELLYGGLEVRRRNLFGLGHSAELRFLQSFKSTEAYLTYSIPDLLAEGVTVFGLADVLSREEVSFRREEVRGGVGARKLWDDSGHQVGLRYNYEVLRAIDAPVSERTDTVGEDQPVVTSFVFEWSLDRRDSPVVPRSGFHLSSSIELARPEFGGEAQFLRPELHATVHTPLGGGRFLSVGARSSWVGDPAGDGVVPFNKRLFPGGDDTVRGYQRGEAAPRNANGDIIGAEAATIWNIEFEQLLTPSWSLVTFVDGVGDTANINESWFDEVLWSVGGGMRWNTVIGPVRLEYGHNLNRRRGDPSGTLHFSVGFPF